MKHTLGAFIALLRKEKGLTQKEFAEILSVSDKTVSHWECDKTSPDITLLPLIADIFGITVDELLRGEKESEPLFSQQYINSATKPIDKPVTQYFHRFKILNIISASAYALSVLIGIATNELLNHVIYSGSARSFAAYITFCGIFISAVFTFIFNIYYKNRFKGTEFADTYCFKANRITSVNLYLGLLCLGFILSVLARYGSLFIGIFLAIVIISETALYRTLLNPKNIFSDKKEERLYFSKRSCALTCAVLIASGIIFQFFITEIYYPQPKNIVFDSSVEFKTYMETPKEKPLNAYLVEDKETTQQSTTTLSPTQNNNTDYPSFITPGENTQNNIEEIVLGYCGGEYITFKWLNNEVYDFSYNENKNTFHIITYKSAIQTEKTKDLCRNISDIIPIYCVMVLIVGSCVYYKKRKEI